MGASSSAAHPIRRRLRIFASYHPWTGRVHQCPVGDIFFREIANSDRLLALKLAPTRQTCVDTRFHNYPYIMHQRWSVHPSMPHGPQGCKAI